MSWGGDESEVVVANRRRYFDKAGLRLDRAVSMHQVHGFTVVTVTHCDAGRGMTDIETRIPDADALISNCAGLILCVFHADCAPVFFADEEHLAIGLAHAGWQGAYVGIAGQVVRQMTTVFGTNPAHLRVSIGPTISAKAYAVPEQRARLFMDRYGAHTVRMQEGRHFLDLPSAIKSDLAASGVAAGAIEASPPCTATNSVYASYRRDGAPVRSMLSWLAIA